MNMSQNTDKFNDNIKSYSDAILRGIQKGLRHPVPLPEDMAMFITGAFNDAKEIFGIKSTAEWNMETRE